MCLDIVHALLNPLLCVKHPYTLCIIQIAMTYCTTLLASCCNELQHLARQTPDPSISHRVRELAAHCSLPAQIR